MKHYIEIEKMKKKERKLSKVLDSQIKEYEKQKKKASCGLCSIYRKALKSDFSQLHTYCTGCPFSNKVSSSYDAFLEAKTSLDRFEINEYAKTIFSCLDLVQPILIEMRTGKEVNWVNAFGDNYSSCVKNGKYKSLIGLFDEDFSSKYKLK